MTKSADETTEHEEQPDRDRDVIELTDEIPAADAPANVTGESPSARHVEEDLDALTQEMPEFRAPADTDPAGQAMANPPGHSDGGEANDHSQKSGSEVPSAAILSGNRHTADPDDPDDPSEVDPADTAPVTAPTSGSTEQPVGSGSSGAPPGYDRQELVKTVQMGAIERSDLESNGAGGRVASTTMLTDQRLAPDAIISPPRVLTTRWREGGPLLRAGVVDPPMSDTAESLRAPQSDESVDGGDHRSVQSDVSGDRADLAESADGLEGSTSTDHASRPAQSDQSDEPTPPAGPEQLEDDEHGEQPSSTSDDNIEYAEELVGLDFDTPPLLGDDEFSEVESDDVDFELAAGELKGNRQAKPPPNPAPKKKPDHKHPPGGQPPPKTTNRPPAGRSPDDRSRPDDPELSNLVQELVDEESQKPGVTQDKRPDKPRDPRHVWFEHTFSDDYLRTVPRDIHRQTKREATFIENSFRLDDEDRILDLACGFGRHAIELSRRGHEVVGLDLSMDLLQKALADAKKQALSIKFVHGDMRDMSFETIFEACFLWQTSFGYFDDKTNYRVLRGIHRALKPDGQLLIDVINRDHIAPDLPRRLWWEGHDCVFLEEVELDHRDSVMHTKRSFIFEDGSPPLEHHSYIRLYSVHELCRLLEAAGFSVGEISGELHHRGQFLGSASSRIVIHAQKRPPRGGRS